MPELIPGYTTEQKVNTVTNSAATINADITAEAVNSWVVSSLTLSGSDMVILYSRTIEIVAP